MTEASWTALPSHRRWLEAETHRLLDQAVAARAHEGFWWLDGYGQPDIDRPLHLWVTARMTHVFALGHLLGRPGDGLLVDHGLSALHGVFRDQEHGGWYAEAREGRATDTAKKAYEHAFVVLAAASATVAERPRAAELLEDALAVVDRRFWDDREGLAVESYDRGWGTSEDYRGANANMHLAEAFLAAADVTGDEQWRQRALRIAERIVHGYGRSHDWRLPEHYDARWAVLPDYHRDQPRHPFRPYGVTPGHGLEWARLVLHLHASLDGPDWLVDDARALFDRAVHDGWDEARGGFVYTTDWSGAPVVADRFHWVAAEAIGAAAALQRVTGEATYERWYRRCWDFVGAHLIDRVHGGWLHELDPQNQPSARTWPGKPDAYHAVQASLIPRLPLAPGLALALRQHRLDT